jgi:hypothetical protein
MKRVLMSKEWAGMRPFAWLLVVLFLLDLLELGAGDLETWHRSFTLYSGSRWTESTVMSLLLSFAMGSGLLARELEDGTLAFLDGLPVRRSEVFLSKLMVAGACLFAYAMLTPVLGWMLHLWLRHSIDEPIAAASVGWLASRYLLLLAAGLALGLLFGFLRYLAWALLAICAAAVLLLRSAWPRAGTALDPTQLTADGWATQGWGGDTVWTVAILTLACLAGAWLLFAGAGGIAMLRLARLAQNRAFKLLLVAAGLAALFVVIYQTFDKNGDKGDDEPGGDATVAAVPATPPTPIAPAAPAAGRARKVVTAHYTFNIPAGRAVDERELKEADAAFATAARALSVEITEAPLIDVDLAGSIRHTAGLASHNRIRVTLEPGWHNTLVHETVHVIESWLAGGERGRGLDKMSLFNEGLAHWAEPAYREDADLRRQERLAVATMFRRHLLNQEELLDDRSLQRNIDWRLQYPLGAGLVETLVKRYGPDAPRRVLATLAQADFPPGLEGYELYRSAFQRADFDLNLVLNDYALELGRWSKAFAPVIDGMPRPRGILVREGGRVGIAVQLDTPLAQGQRLIVQFRPRADSRIDDVVAVERLDRQGQRPVAWLPLDQVAGNQVCYQVGVRTRLYDMVEPWSCLPLRAAADVP